MTVVEFDVEGFHEAADRHGEMSDRVRRPEPAFSAMVADFRRRVRAEFASDGAFEGNAWERLRPAYLENRREEGRGSSILRLLGGNGGRLLGSLLGDNAWAVEEITSTHMQVGTKLGIARIHQTGGTRTIPAQEVTIRRGPAAGTTYQRKASTHEVPARPFIDLGPRDVDRWAGFLRDWIVDGTVPGGGVGT